MKFVKNQSQKKMANFFSKRNFKIFSYFILLPFLVGGSLFILEQKGFFNLNEIEFSISEEQELQNYLPPLKKILQEELDSHKGQSLWRLRLREMAGILEEQSWVESYKLSRVWPDRLQVTLQPKKIRFNLVNKSGEIFPVVGNGQLLPQVGLRNAPDVVFVQGTEFFKNENKRKNIIRILDGIPREGSFSQKSIAEITYLPKEGFVATLVKSSLRVKIGNEENVELKSRRVTQVMDYLHNRGLEAIFLDADFSKKVLVRLNKKSSQSNRQKIKDRVNRV